MTIEKGDLPESYWSHREKIEDQVRILTHHRFHYIAGESGDTYLEGFLNIPPLQEDLRKGKRVVVVDPRIPLSDKIKQIGVIVEEGINIDQIEDDPDTPEKPYAILTHPENTHTGLTVEEAVKNLAQGETGCSLRELIAYYMLTDRTTGILRPNKTTLVSIDPHYTPAGSSDFLALEIVTPSRISGVIREKRAHLTTVGGNIIPSSNFSILTRLNIRSGAK